MNAKRTAIVGHVHIHVGITDQTTPSTYVLRAGHLDDRTHNRIAGFVHDHPRDDASARKREIDSLDEFTGAQLDRHPFLPEAALAVLSGDEADLRGSEDE